MDLALWIIASLLAFAFAAAGAMKLAKSRAELEPQMAWVADASDGKVKAIGAVELLGAIGVVLPGIVNIAPILVPIAAVGLALTMVGAVATHLRRHDPPAMMAPAIALGVLAVVLALGRFGPESF